MHVVQTFIEVASPTSGVTHWGNKSDTGTSESDLYASLQLVKQHSSLRSELSFVAQYYGLTSCGT